MQSIVETVVSLGIGGSSVDIFLTRIKKITLAKRLIIGFISLSGCPDIVPVLKKTN